MITYVCIALWRGASRCVAALLAEMCCLDQLRMEYNYIPSISITIYLDVKFFIKINKNARTIQVPEGAALCLYKF